MINISENAVCNVPVNKVKAVIVLVLVVVFTNN